MPRILVVNVYEMRYVDFSSVGGFNQLCFKRCILILTEIYDLWGLSVLLMLPIDVHSDDNLLKNR